MYECKIIPYYKPSIIRYAISTLLFIIIIIIIIAELRVSYRDKDDVLLEDSLESKNPHELFSIWFKKASERGDVRQPNAACLATATK